MLRLMEPVITFSYLTLFAVHDRAGAYAAFSAGEGGWGRVGCTLSLSGPYASSA